MNELSQSRTYRRLCKSILLGRMNFGRRTNETESIAIIHQAIYVGIILMVAELFSEGGNIQRRIREENAPKVRPSKRLELNNKQKYLPYSVGNNLSLITHFAYGGFSVLEQDK